MLPIEHMQITNVKVTQIYQVSFSEKAVKVFITSETNVIDVVACGGASIIYFTSAHLSLEKLVGFSQLFSTYSFMALSLAELLIAVSALYVMTISKIKPLKTAITKIVKIV